MPVPFWRAVGVAMGFALCFSSAHGQDLPTKKEISRSRQFYVYCDDDNARGQISTACDEVKERLLRVLDIRDQWRFPILVVVRVPSSTETNVAPSTLGVYRSQDGSKLQIDFNITDGIEHTRLMDRVTEAVLTEVAYRGRNTFLVADNYQRPYPWLVSGLAERISRVDNPFPSTLITAILQASSKLSFRTFLVRDPGSMDSVSREIYRAYAMSLVEMLLGQPGGRTGLLRYIKGIPTRRVERMFEFADDFPTLGGPPESVDKWWTLSLAKMTTADQFLPLTPALTEAKLEAILTVRVPESYFEKPKPKKKEKNKKEPKVEPVEGEPPPPEDPENAPADAPPTEAVRTYSITQFREFNKIGKERLKSVMTPVLTGLYALGTTAHPMYYAIVGEYQRVAGMIAEGKPAGLEKDLARMAEVRSKVLQLYAEIDDYMNWVEATQMEVRSGTFDNYMKEAKAAEKAKTERRNDPINRYMDVIEAEMK